MDQTQENTFAVGKYLVSPLVTRTDSGRYAASVSIRSAFGPPARRPAPAASSTPQMWPAAMSVSRSGGSLIIWPVVVEHVIVEG